VIRRLTESADSYFVRAKRRLQEADNWKARIAVVQHQYRKLLRRTHILYSIEPSESGPRLFVLPSDLRIVRMTAISSLEGTDRRAVEQFGGPVLWKKFRAQIERGEQLWICRIGQKLAGVCWSVPGRKIDRYFVPLGERDALVWKCFTLPAFRGRGVYPATLRRAVTQLRIEGVRRVFADTQDWNAASRRGLEKAGFVAWGRARAPLLGLPRPLRRRRSWPVEWREARQNQDGSTRAYAKMPTVQSGVEHASVRLGRDISHAHAGRGPMNHTVCHSFSEVTALAEAWNCLAAEFGDLFCSFEWCRTWWRHYGDGRSLHIHIFLKGTDLVGVVPMFGETHRIGPVQVRSLRLLGCDHTTTTCSIPIHSRHAEDVISAVVRHVSAEDWDLLHLGPLPEYFLQSDLISRRLALSPGFRSVTTTYDPRPQVLLGLPSSFDAYLSRLSKRERHSVRKEERRLRRDHGMSFVDGVATFGVAPAFREFVEFHQQQWMAQRWPGHFKDWPNARAFHEDVVRALRASGRLVLRFGLSDTRPCCATYGVCFGRRIHWLLAARSLDPRWHFCFLGRVAACDLVRTAIAQGVREIDMGVGHYDYKLRLGGALHPVVNIVAVRGSPDAFAATCLLRLIALAHDFVGYHLWYQRLARRVLPGRVTLNHPGWVHTRMWPSDACRAANWLRTSFGTLRCLGRVPHNLGCGKPRSTSLHASLK